MCKTNVNIFSNNRFIFITMIIMFYIVSNFPLLTICKQIIKNSSFSSSIGNMSILVSNDNS